MLIGVTREIKNQEYRVGMIPATVKELTNNNHRVLIEQDAGVGASYDNDDYIKAGAAVAETADDIFAKADMIVKVKEPQAQERKKLREGQILFTYLHLAPDLEQTRELVESKAVCIAYETITAPSGGLPLLAPMSEVAGRLAVQAGSHCLERAAGGRGVLLGGVSGTGHGKVVILGAGIVGINSAVIALGMGAHVVLLDNSVDALRRAEVRFGNNIETVFSNTSNLERHLADADLVIGGVLIPGALAPKLITAKMIKGMPRGAVVVDVAIDQGGCLETSHPTTHSDPSFVVDEVIHYCVANMPSMVARTAAIALNNTTLPYIVKLANVGYKKALAADPHFAEGLNVHHGKITCQAVADAQDLSYTDKREILTH